MTCPERCSPFKSSGSCPRSLWWLLGLSFCPSKTSVISHILFDNNSCDHSYSLSSPPTINMGSKLCFSLSCNQWKVQKEQTRRAEEIVMPEIEKLLCQNVSLKRWTLKTSNIRGDRKYLQKYQAEKCIQLVSFINSKYIWVYCQMIQLNTWRKELSKQYNCSPLSSIVIPPLAQLSQLPIFVGFTVVLLRLSIDPTRSILKVSSHCHLGLWAMLCMACTSSLFRSSTIPKKVWILLCKKWYFKNPNTFSCSCTVAIYIICHLSS